MKQIGEQINWSDKEIIRAMEYKLKDTAKSYYFALRDDDKPALVEGIRKWLKSVFGKRTNFQKAKMELATSKRKPDETLGAFAQRLKMTANNIFPKEITNEQRIYRDALIAEQFVNGLDTRLTNKILAVGVFLKLEDALGVAQRKENIVDRLKLSQPEDLDEVGKLQGTTKIAVTTIAKRTIIIITIVGVIVESTVMTEIPALIDIAVVIKVMGATSVIGVAREAAEIEAKKGMPATVATAGAALIVVTIGTIAVMIEIISIVVLQVESGI
ncbi:unnamed protein product [Brassicogethes aeneus]|uniref:Retrotransposon gag domain-containing protein n=1 Tax=Brassicogethes aeneus TaxID=1431903 RepID=A0A9P0FKQ1_BRAAE|nr:unnamed protein product [Brassicogethes aeneus]